MKKMDKQDQNKIFKNSLIAMELSIDDLDNVIEETISGNRDFYFYSHSSHRKFEQCMIFKGIKNAKFENCIFINSFITFKNCEFINCLFLNNQFDYDDCTFYKCASVTEKIFNFKMYSCNIYNSDFVIER